MWFKSKTNQLAKIDISLPYDPGKFCGLFRLDVDITDRTMTDGAWVRVSFDDPNVSTCERTIEAADLNGQRLSLVINSHLLRSGPARLTVDLFDGVRRLGSQTIRLHVSNAGPLADQVARSLREKNVSAVFFDKIDSSFFDYADDSLTPWFDRSTANNRVAQLVQDGALNHQEAACLSCLINEGYTTLPVNIDEDLIDRVNADLNRAIEKRWQNYDYGSSQRLEHLHSAYSSFYELWTHPRILHFLGLAFGVPARPCQTLTYVFGSQQDLHQDTVHLTPFPAGYMCGVWVALEDVKQDSGELIVIPGSHRWPRVYMKTVGCPRPKENDWSEFGERVVGKWREMVSEYSGQPKIYRPKKGEVLIWHENLMHGGSVRVDKSLSRRSVVGHYFADGAIVYYDSSGMPGAVL